MNRRLSSTATTNSTIREIPTTPTTKPLMSSRPTLLASVAAVILDRSDIFRTTARPITEANVMMPNPPIWISNKMTIWPNGVQ